MRRFFFNIRDGQNYLDEEGLLLGSLEDARQEALRGAREIMAENLKRGLPLLLEERIEIVDEHGTLLSTITFREAAGLDGRSDG